MLVITVHHIVSDGWSMGIFFREIGVLYDAFREHRPSPLPPLPCQYADFAAWQRRSQADDVQRAHLEFWKEQLRGSTPTVNIPTDRPRDVARVFKSECIADDLPEPLSNALRSFSRTEGVTLFMTLLGAFQVLLHRHTRDHDIAVASPLAGRTRADVEGLIGYFVTTPLIRSNVSDDPTFRELVFRLRDVMLQVHAHQDIPFEALAGELGWSRSITSPAMFNVMFNFLSFGDQCPEMKGLATAHVHHRHHAAKVDLALVVTDNGQQLNTAMWSDTHLFHTATSERLLGRLRTLLEAAVANPDQRVSTMPLLDR